MGLKTTWITDKNLVWLKKSKIIFKNNIKMIIY